MPGSPVFTARAADRDQEDVLRYSITSEEFSIGETSGRVVTRRKFDFEAEREFSFVLTALSSSSSSSPGGGIGSCANGLSCPAPATNVLPSVPAAAVAHTPAPGHAPAAALHVPAVAADSL